MRGVIMGAGASNRGAELMLKALVAEMRVRHPEVSLGISPGVPGYGGLREMGLARLNIPLPNVGHRFRFLPVWWIRNMVPEGVFGWAWRSLDVVLDISGFAYSDQWGTSAARNLGRVVADVRRRGGRVILFPQAFGPFELPGHAALMREALSGVSVAFARDRVSLDYLQALQSGCEVLLCPDLTLTFETSGGGVEREGWVAVVPNVRMIDQGRHAWGEEYMAIMRSIIERVRTESLEVRLVIHDDGGEDEDLAHRILAHGRAADVTIVRGRNAVELKHLLGSARFLVASRFHALASSLSCGVPALALGWSHKYAELLASYGIERFAFAAPSNDIHARVDELLDSRTLSDLRSKVEEANQRIRATAEGMWSVVDRVLSETPAATEGEP